MKTYTQKTTTQLTLNEYNTHVHIVMILVYGLLFGAWVVLQLQ